MYAVARRYEFDPKSTEEIDRKVRDEFIPLIRKAPGLIAYYWLNTAEGAGMSVSIFETKAGAEESTRLAADYVKDNLAGLVGTPEITQGEVQARVAASVSA